MTITVRPLTEADHDAWLPLWLDYLRFYKAEVPTETTVETWRRVTDPQEAVLGLGALDGVGRLVGFTFYFLHPATWNAAPRCYLEDLFVADSARGKGAGRALMQGVFEDAARRGAYQVYWHTDDGNAVARRLYDRVGTLTDYVRYQR